MTATLGVAMCVWNGERFLAEAIRSVLDQSRIPDEIVLFDDGSTDRTVEIAGRFPVVRVVTGAHAGLAAARNRVIGLLNSDLVTFLDADDLMPPGSLASRERTLVADPETDAVFGGCIQFDDATSVREPAGRAQLAATLLARRAVFERTGPFDESLRVGEFIDWWARAEDLGVRSMAIADVALLRRNHDTNMTRSSQESGSNQDYLRVVRERLKRRQAAQ